MILPRSALVGIDAPPWNHVVSHYVRRASLSGQNYFTGNTYEHRRGRIEEHILERAA
ncbi:Type I secretion system protein TolC [Ectothiorhodospira haloalkaliphila]|uniref:Type I secretion system protein TolC n=1 Tax=Ectothiorhodospira haloalkaliphila TaxID=421628 RepID=UPI001EE81234|nr:Type I secretion system protein TolC [Ectothiorhodospira haloalkaliphila]MCG5526477.1 Type I secretion system protein TolC [Ectothiorhodospira haloalkaliphila]